MKYPYSLATISIVFYQMLASQHVFLYFHDFKRLVYLTILFLNEPTNLNIMFIKRNMKLQLSLGLNIQKITME